MSPCLLMYIIPQTMSGENPNEELWHGYLREGVFVDTQGRPIRG